MSSDMPRKSRNEMVPSSSCSCRIALCMGKWLGRGDGYERRTEIESKRVLQEQTSKGASNSGYEEWAEMTT
jgi:hypothetical protein